MPKFKIIFMTCVYNGDIDMNIATWYFLKIIYLRNPRSRNGVLTEERKAL